MTFRTVRRLAVGFVAGISAGWIGGLLRTPRDASPAVPAAEERR
ncbi:MAG: hypothetical protein QOG49_1300 [Frankiaceae bacterium]|jgi:hypothetical protein|nr:hypothetical protein [Frankiaceae bacterium]